MENLIDIMQLSTEEIDELVNTALRHHRASRRSMPHKCDGKILATLFFEPSTRTRLSFESAMLCPGRTGAGLFLRRQLLRLQGRERGGHHPGGQLPTADIIAMRHPKEGAPLVATQHSLVPVINAGDGGHNHPTQTLTDLLTIHKEKGHLDNLTIGFCGDLKFGRTVHSLVAAMSRYTGVRFVLDLPGGAEAAPLRQGAVRQVQEHSLYPVHLSGGGHAGAGYSVHDPRPEGALLQ